MSTTTVLTDKLEDILTIKSSVLQAILDKGGTFSGDDDFINYPAAIHNIPQTIIGDEYWIFKGKIGEITDLSGYSLENYPAYSNGCRNLFENCTYIIKAPSPGSDCTTIASYGLAYAFYQCSNLTQAPDFSKIRKIYSGGLQSALSNTKITSLDFSSLEYVASNAFSNAFNSCTKLKTITVNPAALTSSSTSYNILSGTTYVENLYLSDYATNNIYLSWLSRLRNESYLHVLQHLGTISGTKTAAFPTKVIEDIPGGEYITAYNAAVARGWNITGLTVKNLEYITLVSGNSLNLKDGTTISFTSLYNWTADSDDPSVILSSYSGSAGESNTISISFSGWNGVTNINLHTSDGSYTTNVSVKVYYRNNYTAVEYLQAPESSFCDFGTETFRYDDKMTMDVYWPEGSSYQEEYDLGNHSGTSVYVCRMIYGFSRSSILYDFPNDTGSRRLRTSLSNFTGRTLTSLGFDESGHPTISVNNNLIATMNYVVMNEYSGHPFKIFGISKNVNPNVKYYKLLWERGGELTHDYRPALDGNNVACLYDDLQGGYIYPTSGSCRPGPII